MLTPLYKAGPLPAGSPYRFKYTGAIANCSRRCPTLLAFWWAMARATDPTQADSGRPDPDRLRTAVHEARDDAAPFALFAAVILVVLALVSMHANW
jgi:hypothetical protein